MRQRSALLRSVLALGLGLLGGCTSPLPPSIDHPLVGYMVPAFEAPTIDNDSVNVPSFQGTRVTVIDFWASWCGSCMDTMPELEGLYRERKRDGLAVVGVSVDETAHDAARGAMAFGLTFPIIHDRGHDLAAAFRISQVPTTFVLDRTGAIRYVGRNPTNVRLAVNALLDR